MNLTHAWDDFLASYEKRHRRAMGPLRPDAVATVRAFLRCGDLAAGFTRFHCPDCGHEKLLAFTCQSRHFWPACHQRRVRQTGEWIAASVCHDVPHRQFVFTFPKMLRGIFRKRRRLLHLLFQTATECLRDAFEYLLRAPFSLQKILWNAETKTVLYRSRRSWRTKRNFEVFTAADFSATAIDHIPPKGQQTVRHYGLHSNKSRGLLCPATSQAEPVGEKQPAPKPRIVPPPPKATAPAMRPLWRDLILRVWGTDPLQCPCCKGAMNVLDAFFRPGEIEFFLRLHGLWESVVDIHHHPIRHSTSKNAEGSEAFWTQAKPEPAGLARRMGRANQTFQPIEPPWQAIREWIPADDGDLGFDLFDQRAESRKPVEVPREDGCILVLDGN